VQRILDDWRSAPLDERLRATLGFLERLTLEPASVTAADVAPLKALGLSEEAIEDAIHVTVLFNIYDRMADTLAFDIPPKEGFAQGASRLLARGYQ
jgi:alkylhydroperoxidase family enzyme